MVRRVETARGGWQEAPLTLAAGSRLGPYEILSALGAGGMGEVYRARDTRLSREVALKILTGEVARDSARLRRFQTEAQSSAALSHPNIVSVYDVGEEEGIPYIVSELVEGRTLATALARGRFPTRRLLDLAVGMAEGLAAAHAAGIVHRDLKPANVLLSASGVPKIADFGLAKAFRPSTDPEGTHLTTLPDGHMTEGTILGTVGYMSPEQAQGLPADFRSDQFSFGAILYEMATGQRAFQRSSSVQTLAAIVQEEPEPIAAQNSEVPAPIRWTVERCLAKDPKSRYASTEDLARDLATVRNRLSELDGSGERRRAGFATARRIRSRRLLLVVVAGALAAAVVAALLIWPRVHRESAEPREVARFGIDLPGGAYPDPDPHLAISPDGTALAYAVGGKDRLIHLRHLDRLDITPLAGTQGALFPFFSPDGKSLGFFSGGKLKRISLAGGSPITLCEAGDARGATWGADGDIYFASIRFSAIRRIPAAGGAEQAITTLAKDEMAHRNPEALPGSGALVYTSWTKGGLPRIAVLSPGSRQKVVMENAWGPRYLAGYLFFIRAEGRVRTLFAGLFDVRDLAWKSVAVPVLEDIESYGLSRTGTLAYFRRAPEVGNGALVRVDRRGSEKRLTDLPRAFYGPRLSPNGTRVAVGIGPDAEKSDIWVYEIERRALSRLTHDEKSSSPTWTPDGTRLCFSTMLGRRLNIFCQTADGSAEAKPLLESPRSQWAHSISPDGAWLAFSESKAGGDMWLFPLSGGGHAKLLLATPYNEWGLFFLRTAGGSRMRATNQDASRSTFWPFRVLSAGGRSPRTGEPSPCGRATDARFSIGRETR